MASMHISLSDKMKKWVEGQIAGGRYHNASEYVRDLIRRDQDDRARLEDLRAHLAQGEADIAAGRFETLQSKDDVAKLVADAKRRTR